MDLPRTADDMNALLMRPLALPAGMFPYEPGRRLVTGEGHRVTTDDRLNMIARSTGSTGRCWPPRTPRCWR